MAETYRIYDMRDFKPGYIATLVCGLQDGSRLSLRLSGQNVSTGTLLQALAVDALNFIAWTKTEDAEAGQNRPASVFAIITGNQKMDDVESYRSGEEFDRARAKIMEGGG